MEELQLLVHYMNATAKTLSIKSDLEVWTKVVPEEASQHDFLMDGLLALSALHFASSDPTGRWRHVEYASHYQASALRKYTLALQSVTERNSHAIFAHSIVTMILALAFTTTHTNAMTVTPVDELTSFFGLLRGVGFVNNVSRTHLREGPFQALWTSDFPQEGKLQLWPDVANAMEELMRQTERVITAENSDRQQVYLSSIERLDCIFKRLRTSHILRDIIAWPALVDRELLDYLRDRDPIAHLIFLYYGVLLLRAHGRWWGRGFGSRLIEHIATSLCVMSGDFSMSVEWARKCAALTDYDSSEAVRGCHGT